MRIDVKIDQYVHATRLKQRNKYEVENILHFGRARVIILKNVGTIVFKTHYIFDRVFEVNTFMSGK